MPVSPILTLAELMQPLTDAEKLDLFFRLLAGSIRGQTAPSVTLDQLAAFINEGFNKMSDKLQTGLDQLKADIASQATVIASATTAFQGLSQQLADALAAAKAAGATEAQLAELTSLQQGVEANTAALAAAVPQNTPAAAGGDEGTGQVSTGTADATGTPA